MISRRLEVEYLSKSIEKGFGRPFPDADGSIALHVAVTPHRTKPRARLTNLTAQQHQVHDLLNVRDCVAMLRQSHGPAKDRALRFDEDLGSLFDLLFLDSALLDDRRPRNKL